MVIDPAADKANGDADEQPDDMTKQEIIRIVEVGSRLDEARAEHVDRAKQEQDGYDHNNRFCLVTPEGFPDTHQKSLLIRASVKDDFTAIDLFSEAAELAFIFRHDIVGTVLGMQVERHILDAQAGLLELLQ